MVNLTDLDTSSTWKSLKKEGYTIYQSGSHLQGNFIQVFVPDNPHSDEKKLKLITYLHGFALCLPKFYEKHLEKLARQGYYVFFPDFQKSDYPDNIEQDELVPSENKRHLYFWYQMAIDTIAQRKKSSAEKFSLQQKKAEQFYYIRENPREPSALKCFFIALAIIVIILTVRLIYLFSPTYSKNLVKLISTVGLSLLYYPSDWIKTAIDRTADAWQKLSQDNLELKKAQFDFYVFGHSLGGLLALSWPAFVQDQKFFPKQILTADPAPSTEMGIPGIALFILRLFRSPFTISPISIRDTGLKINIPVGILHGADDTIVKPQSWVERSAWNPKSNYDYIASPQKQIYFSLSQKQLQPPLIAFHNQAVTDTTYFDAALFNNFGGVKIDPNVYNYDYIWLGLDLVVENKVPAHQLIDYFPKEKVQVTETLPPSSSSSIGIIIVAGLVLLGLAYWLWPIAFN